MDMKRRYEAERDIEKDGGGKYIHNDIEVIN
jgi:hypothetical protein